MYKAIWLPFAMAAAVGAQEEAAWQPIACTPGPLRLSQRFDRLQRLETPLSQWQAFKHGQAATVAVTVEPTAAPGGSAALRVDYEFAGDRDLEYIDIGPDLPLAKAEPGAGFALQVKESVGLPLRARVVDASGETHQFDLWRERGGDWCAAGFSLDQHGNFWGGDGNGRLDYPCRLHSILFDKASQGYKAKGTLWIAAVSHARAVERKSSLIVEASRLPFGNLFAPGDTIRLRVRGDAPILRWRWSDYWGTDLGRGEGAGSGTETRLVLPAPGHYTCTVEAIRDDDVLDTVVFRGAALPTLPADAPANGFVGFTCHFGHNLAYPLACMELLRDYGFSRFRDEISWRSVETQRGQHALPAHAVAWTARARELGLHPLLILDYSNPHYDNDGFPNSPEAIRGFAAYAAYMATALQGSIDEFEVWNEWTGGCGMGGKPGDHGPEAYGRLLQAVYPAVKQAQPQATVVGIGGEYGARVADTVESMVRAAGSNAMDAFSIHPYRYPRTPEQSGLVEELRRLTDRAAAAGAPRRLWITEIGWPTHSTSRGVDELTQAQVLVRALALMQGSGAVEKVHLYDFKNDGARADYNEHNFGLVLHQDFNCAPKPAAVAVAVFARMTAAGEPLRLLAKDEVYGTVYRLPRGSELLVTWSTRAEAKVEIAGEAERLTDLMGRTAAAPRGLTLTPNPVYITGRNLGLVGLEAAE